MLRLLPPMFEPSVQQIMLLQIVKLCCRKQRVVNPFTVKCGQRQVSTKFQNFIFQNCVKQIASCESTGRELSFEWSHHRISSTDSKVRVTLQNSIKHSGSEMVKWPYSDVWRKLLTLNVFTWDKIEVGCSLQLISPQHPTHQKQTNKNIDHPPPQSFVSYKFIEMFPLYCRLCTAGCLKGMMLSWTS